MNQQVSNALTALAGLFIVTWVGFEVSRRRHKLKELFDVLDKGDRNLTLQLEKLVQENKIRPL
jgi:DNA mismatch repair protein MutH